MPESASTFPEVHRRPSCQQKEKLCWTWPGGYVSGPIATCSQLLKLCIYISVPFVIPICYDKGKLCIALLAISEITWQTTTCRFRWPKFSFSHWHWKGVLSSLDRLSVTALCKKILLSFFSFHLYGGISFGMLCSFPLLMCDHNVHFVLLVRRMQHIFFPLGVAVIVNLVRFLSFGTLFCYSLYCRNVASSTWFC